MSNYCSYVNSFIGIDSGGNCLCGPYLPNSIVRIGPDSIYPMEPNGYSSAKPISRFSHTHVAGTGGGSHYGNIGITPYIGPMRLSIDPCEPHDEYAEPGYYSVRLKENDILAELTLTPRVGCHRYTFPKDKQANILLDAGSVIEVFPHSDAQGGHSAGGFVEVLSNTEIIGRSDLKGGWGSDFCYSIYFYARFDEAFAESMCADSTGYYRRKDANGVNCRVSLRFEDKKVIHLKVGISHVSIANARESFEREAAALDFDGARRKARQTWEEMLSRIAVEGGSEEHTVIFYSLFIRLMYGPTDLGFDENPYWKSKVRCYTDFYALWDSVRNANSLIGLFNPQQEVDMLNCLIEAAEHIGWLPDAYIAGHAAMMQGGSSADILISEAAQKGMKGIDYEKALKYMRKNNEEISPDTWLYGRHLEDYRDLGYLSTNIKRSRVSKHMEYAYQDWCIGKLADILGHTEVAGDYYESSRKLWNLWNDDLKLFAPRKPNGEWDPGFDPEYMRPDPWNDENFYEASAWQWVYNTQHDFSGLIRRSGGKEAFIEKLDRFFDEGHYHSKETMLHIPYLFTYAGRPDKTARRVQEVIEKFYSNTRSGISDNEDAGCQSAFYICSAIGVYPMMGQDHYILTAPLFERTVLSLGDSGKKLIISAPGAGKGPSYIVAAKLNGKPLHRAWIRHGEIADGAELELELSEVPNEWGFHEILPTPMDNL